MTDERAPVFPGGLAILAEVFDVLEHRADARSPTARCARDCCTTWSAASPTRTRATAPCGACSSAITSMARRPNASKRRRSTFCARSRAPWKPDDPLAELVLGWAARLHEIGLDVSHSHYQKHGAYLLENADMPGFPREEQMLLAALVGGHRRKIVMVENDELLPPWDKKALYLSAAATRGALHRGRSSEALPTDHRAAARPVSDSGVPARLAEGSPAHGRGPAQRGRPLEDDRLQAARVRLYPLTPIWPGAA